MPFSPWKIHKIFLSTRKIMKLKTRLQNNVLHNIYKNQVDWSPVTMVFTQKTVILIIKNIWKNPQK